jgi:large subunit ribosomal protein L15
MVVRKKKKVRKFRGKRSYGYGSHKKHRGGGSRGGRGKAGMHKHKWSYTVKYDPDHFGSHGFSRSFAKDKRPRSINLRDLDTIAKKTGKKDIDLAELGYDKVLGTGKLSGALNIKAKLFSKKALEKIESMGGKAIKTEVKKESNKE